MDICVVNDTSLGTQAFNKGQILLSCLGTTISVKVPEGKGGTVPVTGRMGVRCY